MSDKTKEVRSTILVAIVGAVIIACLILFGYLWANNAFKSSVFTPEAWHEWHPELDNGRIGIARDLVERELLLGKDKDSVAELLGSDYTESSDNQWFYRVNGRIQWPSDLVIKFDDEGKVIDYFVFVD